MSSWLSATVSRRQWYIWKFRVDIIEGEFKLYNIIKPFFISNPIPINIDIFFSFSFSLFFYFFSFVTIFQTKPLLRLPSYVYKRQNQQVQKFKHLGSFFFFFIRWWKILYAKGANVKSLLSTYWVNGWYNRKQGWIKKHKYCKRYGEPWLHNSCHGIYKKIQSDSYSFSGFLRNIFF